MSKGGAIGGARINRGANTAVEVGEAGVRLKACSNGDELAGEACRNCVSQGDLREPALATALLLW